MSSESVPLGTCVRVIGGFAFKSESFSDEGIPVIRISDIQNGLVSLSETAKIPNERIGKGQVYCIEPEDILIAMSGATTGKIGIVPNDFIQPVLQNQRVGNFKIINFDKINKKYLKHYLISSIYQHQIWQSMVGVAQPNISSKQLEEIEIPLPSIAEQKRIAAILDKAEELRGLRRRALSQLDSLAQSIFLEMFGDPVTNPKGWSQSCLGDVATFVGGGTPKRERPEYFKGSICWATSKDMKHEFLDDTQEHITPQAIAESATNLVPIGTVLIVVKSKILAHSLPLAITRVPTCFGQDIKGIKVSKRSEVSFVVVALRYGKRWLLERARGINTEGLTLDHLRAFPLGLPPLPLQQEFARRVEAIAQLKTTHRESLAQLDSLFASLQHRAFSPSETLRERGEL